MIAQSLLMYPAKNELGYELLERFVRPLAEELGIVLSVPEPDWDRRHLFHAVMHSTAAILDCSVEPGHIYHDFTEIMKSLDRVLLCSRTALPRNVFGANEFAPAHGGTLSNLEIDDWLRQALPGVLAGKRPDHLAGILREMMSSSRNLDRALSAGIGNFVSFRASQTELVGQTVEDLQTVLPRPARVVPKGQFAYELECLPKQRMWDVVSRLANEIRVANSVTLFISEDYFSSFWTCSELLAVQAYFVRSDGLVRNGYIYDVHTGQLRELRFGSGAVAVKPPTRKQLKRFHHLRRNHSPGSMAPEARRPRQQFFDRAVGWVIQRIGFYDPEFTRESWWRDTLVPCPKCQPNLRQPGEVDWDQHLSLGGYGYFSVSPAALREDAPVRCPRCRAHFYLRSSRAPRTLWIPGPTGRPWPRDMEVIGYEPVWEVSPT